MIDEIGKEQLVNFFECRQKIGQIQIPKYNNLEPINANSTYVKYTPKSNMYNILDTDSLYLFSSELSNDLTENNMLSVSNPIDTYITCFYQGTVDNNEGLSCNDVYSQWMSYCPDGGASFEFYFGQALFPLTQEDMVSGGYSDKIKNILNSHFDNFSYSLLCDDQQDDSEFIKYYTFPFQMQYFDNDIVYNDNSYMIQIKSSIEESGLSNEEMSAYFKHSGFIQESEARLALFNKDNQLSKCIRFMTKNDGTRLPYIVVKFGDSDANKRPCRYVTSSKGELAKTINNKIKEIPPHHLNKQFPIVIPQGHNQEEIYNLVEQALKNRLEGSKELPPIICMGHLPITKITLAPTPDRKLQKRQMEMYCKSKYWLRNVEICESKIPYNTYNNNHV